MKKMFVAICLTATVFSAEAQYQILGSGALSCGKLIADKDKSHLRPLYDNWVLGYLSGISAATNIDLLAGYDREAVAAAVEKYCRENPLKDVSRAADDVALQMFRMKK